MSTYRDSALLRQSLGDRLRKSRKVAGLTTEDMAAVIGKSRQAVNGYEHDTHSPSLEALRQWAEACNVPVEWLAFGDDASTTWYTPAGGDVPREELAVA